jgi:hypothetical protein
VDTKVLLGIKGLLAGQLSRTELHGYDSLPFSINEDLQDFQIYAAEKTGTVVIGTIAGDFYLAPGESWKSVSQIDPALMQSKQACYTDHVYELINQGMVEKSAVQYSEMPDSK